MPLNRERLCSLGSLSSKFSDLKVIAGGGGGVVLSGVDKSLSQGHMVDKQKSAVALKRLSLVGKGHCRVALRELRLLKRFQHENVVKTIKITDSGGSTIEDPSMENFKDLDAVYVVEELLDSDLHKIIESNGKLPLETTKLFLYQLLRGLKYIHSANVVHRDIKPGNLFANEHDLSLKIGDYGLARVFDKRFDHKGYLTAVVSTRYYRAPEVMLNLGDYSFPIDIWSAGCVFGEMLLGKVMFKGENDLDQINVICSAFGLQVESFYDQETSFPEHWFHGLPPEAIDLLSKLLCIQPSNRLTAEEALKHPFFSDLHDITDEPECEQPFYIEHEIDNIPLKILKRKILQNSCLNLFDKKSYHSSEENLFKDFDETLVDILPTCARNSTNIRLNSRGDETSSSNTSTSDNSIESSQKYINRSESNETFLPSLTDAIIREELRDEPFRDPGVCERKYHESLNNVDNISNMLATNENQQVSYFSGLSPVIEMSDPLFPGPSNANQSFLGIPGHYCVNRASNSDITDRNDWKKSQKSLNRGILRTLNKDYAKNCSLEELMTDKFSKSSTPFVHHWDSIRFWI